MCSRYQFWGIHHCRTVVWIPAPHMIWEAYEFMEETEYKVIISGSEPSPSRLGVCLGRYLKGTLTLQGLQRFAVTVRDPNSAVQDTIGVQPCPTPLLLYDNPGSWPHHTPMQAASDSNKLGTLTPVTFSQTSENKGQKQ